LALNYDISFKQGLASAKKKPPVTCYTAPLFGVKS